jgi:sialate O-acetylesterase
MNLIKIFQNIIFRLSFVVCLFFNLTGFSQSLSLPSVFSDNMILQQKTKINIWGGSFKGDEIIIKTSWGQKAVAHADQSGKWMTTLSTLDAGGPYEISVTGKNNELQLKNIFFGEVWICSGQSNMEMTFSGWPPKDAVFNAAEEIKKIGNSKIRMFTVAKTYSLKQEDQCKGSWKEANPESLKKFSAVAYYFGNELFKQLNVPIGLVNTSWEGTQIKSWTSLEALSIYPEFAPLEADFQQMNGGTAAKEKWLEKHSKIDLSNVTTSDRWKNLNFSDSVCATTNFSDLEWERMTLPVQREKASLGEFDGAVWFRKWVDVPTSWKGKVLQINIPGIDGMDQTWVNAVKVGAVEDTGYEQIPRHYELPASLITSNKVLVAIRIINYKGTGGIWNTKTSMSLTLKQDTSQKVMLSGKWKYLVVAEYKNNMFYIFDIKNREYQSRVTTTTVGPNTPSVLFNSMVYPLAPYSIKGFLWYQGESNIGSAEQYPSYLSSMVKDWCRLWERKEIPFYYVQIAPYKYSGISNTESAVFRNAQRVAIDSVKHSGMVVTLDIGDVAIIHPSKKKEVGERLAYWALAKVYQKDIPYSGPLYKSFKIESNKIRLNFEYAENGLVGKESILKGFEIAGSDKNYVLATASIESNTVVVYSDKIEKPLYVRYAWHNDSEASLMNKEGLPASTFTTE